MKAFSSRNPIIIGLVSMAVIAVLLVVAYRADSLPIIGSGPEYKAQFSEAAGLQSGNEVRIAGVRVGKVTDVSLEGNHVLIKFRAKDADIGNASSASIQIKTLLGEKYLAIDPAGDRPLATDSPIPLERTVAPYDVVQAFNQLSTTVGQLDTNALAASLRTLAETFKDTPADVRTSLDGLSRLSVTIASRDDQLAHLLDNTNRATGTLAARNDDINKILSDGTKLLDELRAREGAISQLLDGTRRLSKELRGLIKDNEDQIGPTLDELDRLTKLLQDNEDALVAGIRRLGPFATVFSNALGNGRWFDSFVDGLLPSLPSVANPSAGTGGNR
ncbi:MCE family protein [Pseudonocardia spinosispora]|uniref:MCE family protein n=1 Tax=Pseudonocardia spinosispora TaxID=103441 RepID=UPI0004209990|nr:MCE family protein [Pseudonocardia spinosispora]